MSVVEISKKRPFFVVILSLIAVLSGCGNSDSPVTNYEFAADSNTVGLWHFNEGSGQTVSDSSSNNWDLVLGSDATIQTIDPAWTTSGRFGSGVSFTAAETDYVSGPGVTAFSGNEITVEFWIKTSATNTSHPVTTSNIFFFAQLNGNGRLQFGVGNGINWSGSLLASTAINDDLWHYVALVYDGPNGNMYLYIDGALDNSLGSVTTILTNPSTFYVGGRPSNTFVDGRMDEVRVSSIARSATEIASNYP